MTDAQKRLYELRQKKKDKIEGKSQLIPFYYHFPKLASVLPGIFKESMTTCMAGTGVG